MSNLSDRPYRAVADALMRRIADGVLKEGEKVPSVARLAAEFGVSTSTVDRVILILREHRLVRGEAGRGRFVPAGAQARAVAWLAEAAKEDDDEEPEREGDPARGASEVHPDLEDYGELPDAAAP